MIFAIISVVITNQIILYRKVGLSSQPSDPQQKTTRVSKLYFDNKKLKIQLDDLSQQKNSLEESTYNLNEVKKILSDDKNRYNIILGKVDTEGQGVTISISHTLVKTQLIDLVNALRNSGAEAIAINKKRTVTDTPMNEFENQPNYLVEVIGDREILSDALTRPGGIMDLVVDGKVEKQDKILLPKVQ